MHFDWYSQTITQQHNVINCICGKSSISPSLPPPPTYHWSQLLNLYDWIFNLIPLVFITSSTTYLESHSFCRNCEELISIKPMQVDFASLCKIIYQKDHLFPNFPFPIEIKKSFLPPSLIVYPSPTSFSYNPPWKADGDLIELLRFKVCNNL